MVLKNVLDIMVPLLWAMFLLGTLVYFWLMRRQFGWLTAARHLFSYRLLWPLLGVLTVNVASASMVFIDPREVGVVVSLLAPNGVREQPMYSGLHLKVPLFEEVVRYPIIIQSYTMSGRPYEGEEVGDDAIRARTADGQLVIIDVTAMFRVLADMAVKLHINWQDRYVHDFIRPALRSFVRSQAARFNVDEINSEKRKAFEEALNELTNAHSRGTGIEPLGILVRNITFSPEYALSVEEKMTAKQRIREAEYKALQMANIASGEGKQITIKARAQAQAIVNVATAEAEAHVVKAKAEAQALERIGEALDQRDNLLTYRYIDKLSPNIRAMLLPSNAPLILPMPELGEGAAKAQPAALPAASEPVINPPLLQPQLVQDDAAKQHPVSTSTQ